ncbi:MAG: hypothetical protein HeimC3_33120 [Candidatus Heimdallarchaeota archaeon LC_3]|nr:MAG: hypothetical protein HeimC3_33120 [Candidatus Heimdallarchaeota archaeon LC_3]
MDLNQLSIRISFGILLNLPVLILVLKKKYLTWPGGLMLAGLTGLILFIFHPLFWVILLIFFSTSSFLSKYRFSDKKEISLNFSKTNQRDVWQVLANNLGFVLFAFLHFYFIDQSLINVFSSFSIAAFTYLAVMNADTWATEIGIISNKDAHYILNLRKKVPSGTSGGVSISGTISGLLGSYLISFSVVVGFIINNYLINLALTYFQYFIVFLTIGFFGFLGMLVDSILGGLVQVMYYCPTCENITEATLHSKCGGTITIYDKGIKWINNDVVNIISGLLSTVLSFLFIKTTLTI